MMVVMMPSEFVRAADSFSALVQARTNDTQSG
jgi:hypothetical protein